MATEAQNRANAAYRERNREKIRESDRALYAVRRERVLAHKQKTYCPLRTRNKSLRELYGINLEIYDQMLAAQNGACAICKREESGTTRSKHLFVDHCHTTGKVRGLLCQPCNSAIGSLQESEEVLLSAISYLRETK